MIKKLKLISPLLFKYSLFIIPFSSVCFFYITFFIYIITQVKEGNVLSELGSFGDTFGVINAFFSGLGFAGLIITLVMQQKQISRQNKEYLKQDDYTKNQEYISILFKLLDMYKNVLNEIVINYEHETFIGRDALKKSLFILLSKVKQEKVNEIPAEIRRRMKSNSLTEDDVEVLNFIFYKNLKLLNYSFKRQGRFVSTLHSLLYHLHFNKPESFDNEELVRLVASQLTYIEYNYLFYILISDKSQHQLRNLVVKLGYVKYIAQSHIHEVHKIMCKEIWHIDIDKDKEVVDFPMDRTLIKKIETNKEKIMERLNMLLNA
ncbi:TPA: hypothetical protein ACW2U8_001008 [Enterobacter hormaechei]|uniref:hypothetical protein n=1 Tax=Enterobacter hormaechei TaxID=158836 RepID=UPI0005821B89|nr:hypothetical protein [Enterobacter hormaechei]AJB60667.1 hypothetical protein LI62_00785 [Enterobacter hormaechei subsp. steigerwaltii]KJO33072.1 hypothetical protein SS08_05150 [Enterobacter hormaechei subsp. steigerwaltii]MCZ5806320.1 hypothetical protein [Enterobacter hormaechei]